MEISNLSRDVDYRQDLTDRIIERSGAVAALEREYSYYENLSDTSNGSSVGTSSLEELASTVEVTFNETFDDLVAAVEDMNAIYDQLSILNLNPATLLYIVTTPFTLRTERSLSLRTGAEYGVLALMLSLIVFPLGCLVHSSLQREGRSPA